MSNSEMLESVRGCMGQVDLLLAKLEFIESRLIQNENCEIETQSLAVLIARIFSTRFM